MSLQCSDCGKIYPTNTLLYKHKQLAHAEPKLVIMNHSHSVGSSTSKRARDGDDGSSSNVKKRIIEPPNVQRKITPPSVTYKPPKPSSSLDTPKPDSNKRLTITNKYVDEQADDGLVVIDEYDANSQDYKKLYEDCIENNQQLRDTHKKAIENLKKELRDLSNHCDDRLAHQRQQHKNALLKLEDELEDKYAVKIGEMKKEHDKSFNDLQEQHKKELADYERKCMDQIKILRDQIEAIESEDEELSSLTKAIFNCTTMEEIFKIQKLVKNHQLDEVVKNHLPALQNLFLSLSYGILPLCQPQRSQVTDSQRKIVEKMQITSKQGAKSLMNEKRDEIINLFTIINDSIKLARNTYNRYNI